MLSNIFLIFTYFMMIFGISGLTYHHGNFLLVMLTLIQGPIFSIIVFTLPAAEPASGLFCLWGSITMGAAALVLKRLYGVSFFGRGSLFSWLFGGLVGRGGGIRLSTSRLSCSFNRNLNVSRSSSLRSRVNSRGFSTSALPFSGRPLPKLNLDPSGPHETDAEFFFWFTGFSDGKASFIIDLNFEARAASFSFELSESTRNDEVLYCIMRTLGLGSISREVDEDGDLKSIFKIQGREILMAVIIPIFDSFLLLTSKRFQQVRWRKGILIADGQITTTQAFDCIRKLKNEMEYKNISYWYKSDGLIAAKYLNSHWVAGFFEAGVSFLISRPWWGLVFRGDHNSKVDSELLDLICQVLGVRLTCGRFGNLEVLKYSEAKLVVSFFESSNRGSLFVGVARIIFVVWANGVRKKSLGLRYRDFDLSLLWLEDLRIQLVLMEGKAASRRLLNPEGKTPLQQEAIAAARIMIPRPRDPNFSEACLAAGRLLQQSDGLLEAANCRDMQCILRLNTAYRRLELTARVITARPPVINCILTPRPPVIKGNAKTLKTPKSKGKKD